MSTSKHIDKICCVVLAVTLLITVLFINSESFGVQKASTVMGYEQKLFDTSVVHSVEIIMDDWDEFISECKNEEYYACTVVIDNEAYKNVAIRGKGNTSLTQVESYGNNRYSFKIEFDHYDSVNTYYGLDKLCLNNIIQDNTYMKDYLTYQMMSAQGVASPLCSYAYITVNGEEWGLYLAVEGIEDSFLKRCYGNDSGELYKPDSSNLGGGRGNGEKFDIKDFTESDTTEEKTTQQAANAVEISNMAKTVQDGNQTPPQMPDGQMPGGQMQGGQMPNGQRPDNMPEMPDMPNGQMPSDMPNGEMPSGEMPEGGDFSQGSTQPSADNDGSATEGEATQDGDESTKQPQIEKPDNMPEGGKSGGMMNAEDDVLLKYIDDEFDSYSNIFDNAKTDITKADKKRLINSLKNLSENSDIAETVDVEKVIKYFVVHNFVLNFDSYTGSMVHNYYLYEKDGQMQMIPWDYNLAFGGFQSMGSATELVNYPIDTPVSGGSVDERPMLAWIFENEEYTQLYHQYFSEFISQYFENGEFEKLFSSTYELISPYVEKDPTKFCTYEEFQKGAEVLKEFCSLRAESIKCQLDGTIGSTSETQNNAELVDAGEMSISDMGSMNNSMGGMPARNMTLPSGDGDTSQMPTMPDFDGDSQNGQPPSLPSENSEDGANEADGKKQPEGRGEGRMDNAPVGSESNTSAVIMLAVSIAVLVLGLVFALIFRKKRR